MSTTAVLVDSLALLIQCIDDVKSSASIAVDTEGIDLCRWGTLCLLQLKAVESRICWVVDVVTLGGQAFSAAGRCGTTLKDVLESRDVKKIFFDVRNDSDAMFNQFGIALQNVYDLQLLELAVRSFHVPQNHLKGLAYSLDTYLAPLKSAATVREWMRIKQGGKRRFSPEDGGRYEVFQERPLANDLLEYCAQDVALLHGLEDVLRGRLGSRRDANWESRIYAESVVRVGLSRSASYVPKGRHMALAPTRW